MNVETVVATAVIAAAITAIRHGRNQIAGVWRDATRLEKCGLLLLLVPIPGPVDEIIGALVIARIVRRRRNGR